MRVHRRRPVRVATEALRVGSAVLLAGLVFHRIPATETTGDWMRDTLLSRHTLLSMLTFIVALFVLELSEKALYGRATQRLAGLAAPLVLEAAGWFIGAATAFLILDSG